ncbi:hypothetical protein SBY92_005448 [Candida maltosa Xu316]
MQSSSPQPQQQHQQQQQPNENDDEVLRQQFLHDQQHQPSSSSFSNSNYLFEESSYNDDVLSATTPAFTTNSAAINNNFYGQSINVNLGAISTNSNYNVSTNAGQSSYYSGSSAYNPSYSHYQQFAPPPPPQPSSSSTNSSLYSIAATQSTFTSINTPLQQHQQQQQHPSDIYASSVSMNSFFDTSYQQHSINPSQSTNFDFNSTYPQPPLSATSTSFDTYSSSSPSSFPQPQSQQQQQKIQTQQQKKSKSRTSSSRPSPSIKREPGLEDEDKKSYMNFNANSKNRYRVVRGVSAGGCSTRPPKESIESDSIFLPVELNLNGASLEDVCFPKWSRSEKDDRRRIIRIERIQNGPRITANFTIIGNANENPVTLPPNSPDIDVVEVSCLECDVRVNDEYDSQSSDDEITGSKSPHYVKNESDGEYYQYYITSVEVVEIVELLIGNQFKDAAERRRERGRVRSNLVPFWSKKPISSRMSESSTTGSSSTNTSSSLSTSSSSASMLNTSNTLNIPSSTSLPTNHDYRMELAKRIMGYEIRKPRGFDKEVRILRWDKLIPALKRALQSYYTEIPQQDSHLEF